MTQKELLYVLDAYKHEDNIINICNEMMCIDETKDYAFLKKEIDKHEDMKNKLYKLMESKANE